jgi:hypothetical protein
VASAVDPTVLSNFGLLVSGERPQSWQLVCDDVYGKPVPELVWADRRGRFFAAPSSGLRRSADGCTWADAGGAIGGLAVVDVAFERDAPESVWALAGPERDRVLARSGDGGASFQIAHRFGDGHPYAQLRIAPSDSRRIYASGGTGGSSWLAASVDGGATWTVNDLAGGMVPPPPSAFVLQAVSPEDPQVLFFSLVDAYGDEIWRSEDGGRSLQRVLKGGSRDWMTALAFGATGQTVYAAAAVVPVIDDDPRGRLYISRDGGRNWGAAVPAGADGPAYRCLQFSEGKLYACTNEDLLGQSFLVGVSPDEGRSWSPLLRVRDLGGVKSCVRSTCVASEAWLCDQFGRCPGTEVDAGTGGAGASDAGAGDGKVIDAGDGCAGGRCEGSGGCGCTVVASRGGPLGVFLVVGVLAWRRRFRRG